LKYSENNNEQQLETEHSNQGTNQNNSINEKKEDQRSNSPTFENENSKKTSVKKTSNTTPNITQRNEKDKEKETEQQQNPINTPNSTEKKRATTLKMKSTSSLYSSEHFEFPKPEKINLSQLSKSTDSPIKFKRETIDKEPNSKFEKDNTKKEKETTIKEKEKEITTKEKRTNTNQRKRFNFFHNIIFNKINNTTQKKCLQCQLLCLGKLKHTIQTKKGLLKNRIPVIIRIIIIIILIIILKNKRNKLLQRKNTKNLILNLQ